MMERVDQERPGWDGDQPYKRTFFQHTFEFLKNNRRDAPTPLAAPPTSCVKR